MAAVAAPLVLVTGATGFIGSWVASALLRESRIWRAQSNKQLCAHVSRWLPAFPGVGVRVIPRVDLFA